MLRRALEGVSADGALERPNERTNHMAFLAVHVLDARFFLLHYVGGSAENPFAELLDGASSIEEVSYFPGASEVLEAWESLEATLEERFGSLTDSELDAPSPQGFPIDDDSVLGGVAFLVQHDSYHVGQLAYVRKYLGHPAVGFQPA